MLKNEISSVKGMNDIFPKEIIYWRYIEKHWYKLMNKYCYDEIRIPIVEKLDLFYTTIGDQTDIISKEIFQFWDRKKQNKLALRPEGTAGCSRAMINGKLIYKKQQKIWYQGNMFRYENTQMGRYRQFNQMGIEAFGFKDIDIELEQISLINRFFNNLKLQNIFLEINSIGSIKTREKYKEKLLIYLNKYIKEFDIEIREKLNKNPLRILDSKNIKIKKIIQEAPIISSFYDKFESERLYNIEQFLLEKKIKYKKNPYLVRGLDYYNDFVFEYITPDLGAQGAICAGGRYNKLISSISQGKFNIDSFGCALGMERIVSLIKKNKNLMQEKKVDVFFISIGIQERKKAFLLSEYLRDNIFDLTIYFHLGSESIKKQIKKAKMLKSNYICILTSLELKKKIIKIEYLGKKEYITWTNFIYFFKKMVN